jgi:hypothetical protein
MCVSTLSGLTFRYIRFAFPHGMEKSTSGVTEALAIKAADYL